jgi:hypothetical protein
MKTHDLIEALAQDAGPVRPLPVNRIVAGGAAAGAVLAAVVLVSWLGLRDLNTAVGTSPFWMKLSYTVALGTAGLVALARLARPGGRSRGIGLLALAAVGAIALLAMREAMGAPMDAQALLWMGHSSPMCLVRIIVLSLPIGAMLILAMRRAAPTRPMLAGAAAGLAAGGLGATLYGFFCTETAAPFVLLWYSAALGALIGGRALRW